MQSTLSYFTFTIFIEREWYVLCIQTREEDFIWRWPGWPSVSKKKKKKKLVKIPMIVAFSVWALGRFLGIIGQNPSVSKSNRLH